MTLMRLALRNTGRQPRRTVLTGIAIVIAVAAVTFMDAYLRGVIGGIFETYIRLDAGHIKVLPKKAVGRVRPLPLSAGITDVSRLVEMLEELPGIVEATPRIHFPVLLDKPGGSLPAMGTAVRFSREAGLMDFEGLLVEGRVPTDGTWETVLGTELAREIGLGIGDEMFIVTTDSYGGLGPGLYKIVGLERTGIGIIDRKCFYVTLTAAQEQLAMEDAAMEVVCRVDDGMDGASAVADHVNCEFGARGWDDVQAVPWQKQGALFSTFAPVKFVNLLIMVILAIVAMTTIVNTVLMSVLERTREIGAMRALGFSRADIVKMVIGETLVIGLCATAAGIVIGMTVSLILHKTGIDISSAMRSVDLPIEPVIHPDPRVVTALKAGLFGLVVSLIAAWQPARVAVRLQPARALRTS